MFGDRRHYFLVAIALFALPVCARVDHRGYLATVGPAALRFYSAPVPTTNVFVPPPPAPPVVLHTPKPAKVGTQPASPGAVIMEAAGSTNEVINSFTDSARPEEVVSPQMLLKYFSKSTNGTSTTVIAPLDFNPPRPAEAPSSKATYSTGP